MNLLHMKYVVTVADMGSINKAAEELLVAQPNVSRSIKELEADLGISIFHRTSKGMTLTPEGAEFIGYARNILHQIDEVEQMYKEGAPAKQTFSISVPRASYIADAFARFSTKIGTGTAELFYKETNALRAVRNILEADYHLGIIRYAENYDRQFKDMLAEKGLNCELVSEFRFVLIANRKSTLAGLDEIHFQDLSDLIEIAHADPYVPSMPLSAVKREELPDNVKRRIFVFERGSQFDLLASNPETYMWVSPLPDILLDRYQLIQKPCVDNQRVYRDLLIYRKDYHLSSLDKMFITELCESKRRYL
ncbi:MAG: LysR family transcriptional regulator [Acidaminococcaceae bacterium]|nr:LysR family transcriptional regulator [Acidaminococcaceae bacterium]